ncbi:MAG TPA: heme exporter protein CcmD [Hyphomicrobiaceae bacterium]|nr:heme exporter protein CcmD [Hyphomicrobiaceae bacterium]
MDLGKHAVFIWASYGVVFVVVAGMITWLIAEGRRYAAQLRQLEARGVRRRSSSGDAA